MNRPRAGAPANISDTTTSAHLSLETERKTWPPICRSALDLPAPNSRTECRRAARGDPRRSAHLECSLATMLKIRGATGPASGSLLLGREDEGLARE
jgi:hypothetical protein